MKLIVNYADGVINLPRSVTKNIKTATRDDIAALIALTSEPRAVESLDSCLDDVAASAGISRAALEASLAFWRGTGVISLDTSGTPAQDVTPKAPTPDAENGGTSKSTGKKPAPKRSAPEITGDDAEAIIAASPERRSLLYECQQTLGHMFNNSESAVILSLREYLGLEDEYILLLLAYCARRGKKTVKYAETMAYSLYNDRGIETVEALTEYLSWLEASLETEGRVRALLGMGTRKFSPKERVMFDQWGREYGYGYDMIEAAYNVTVNAIGKPSMPYMNKILGSWHELGFRTPEDAEKGGKRKKSDIADSFDLDDFFRLAVMRGTSLDTADGGEDKK